MKNKTFTKKIFHLILGGIMMCCAGLMAQAQSQVGPSDDSDQPVGLLLPDARSTITPEGIRELGEASVSNTLSRNSETIILDFEGLGNADQVLDFYNGGTSEDGLSGSDFGISFNADALALIDEDAGGSGNFANEPSPSTVMFFLEGTPILNLPAGFDTGFSLFQANVGTAGDAAIEVYAGLDATGTLLGTANLNALSGTGNGDPTGVFDTWEEVSVAFTGTAQSIKFIGAANFIAFDDITFGNVVAGCDAFAGQILFNDESTEYEGCVETDELSSINVLEIGEPVGENTGWIITDAANGNILGLPAAPPFDLSTAPAGTCNIYKIAYEEGLSGLDLQGNIDLLDGCFDLSTPISVTRLDGDVCVQDPCADLGGDEDEDGICDDLDDCVGELDALGVCNGNCQADANENGICDDEEEPSEGCQSYVYYLSNSNGGESEIYSFEIVGGEAELNLINSVDYGCHLAYNEADDLLYLVNSDNGSFQSTDPTLPFAPLSDVVDLDVPRSGSVATAFTLDGKMLQGSASAGNIVLVEADGTTSPFMDAPVSGGDIAIGLDGLPYLITNADGAGIYNVATGMLLSSEVALEGSVTGLATMPSGNLLYTSNGTSTLTGLGADGMPNGVSVQLILDGENFVHDFGDLAYGCSDAPPVNQECDNYALYYVNHGPGVSGSDLYSVELAAGNAAMTHLINVPYQVHIAYNAESELVYLVKADGSAIAFYDADLGALEETTVPIEGDINQLFAAVYNAEDELVYVGDSNSDEIYTIDPVDGTTNFYADAPTQGGDLMLQGGILYLAERGNVNRLHTVVADADGIPDGVSEATLIGSIPDETNGAASSASQNSFITANYGASFFSEISNVDGDLITTYAAFVEGEPFEMRHGDMASGCAEDDPFEEECAYQLYYTHEGPGESGYALWSVTLNGDGTASYDELEENIGGAHIALSPGGDLLYVVSEGNVRTYQFGVGFIADEPIALASGQALTGFPAAVCGADGTLYAANNNEQVYTIDPATGLAEAFGPSIDVNGGDLIIVDGDLWLANRGSDKLLLVSDGGATFIQTAVTEINGAAVLENGNVLFADGTGNSLFVEVDLANPLVAANTYDVGVALNNGDLAGRCIGINPLNPDLQGQCYATEMLNYVRGEANSVGSGQQIADNRANPEEALYEPERIDQLVFVSLGYGGSLTLGFEGAVPNMMGPDLEIVETTFGNNSCASYEEYADVYVSPDASGESWFFAKTICRSDNFVDISSAGDFTYILRVKIVNNNDMSDTPDAFDVDGVVALHNCVENPEPAITDLGDEGIALLDETDNSSSLGDDLALRSYPNPTVDISTVVFTSDIQGRTTVEVWDMSGRLVETIFNTIANAGQEYRAEFNAGALPEGVYIYKLTSGNEVVINKFVVSK